ncbi:hypothetical protein ACN27F_03580 [Solwaraspora sp. WMMB335]|uniref:hypothetical protein n=1 Tax=Solwaraspora sp. WMMB335 TaxID=3404118 RepID=UPI003B93F69F
MDDQIPTRWTIEIDDDVYDVLQRTASTQATDINGALRYLIEVPTSRAAVGDDED